MVKAVGGLVSKLVGLALIVAVAYAGWRWGDAVFPALQSRFGTEDGPTIGAEAPEYSEALGATALQRIEAFQVGREAELALSGAEITSLLRYSRRDVLPNGVHTPTVRFEAGRAYTSGQVALADFPKLPDLGPVAGMLPDTVSLELRGSVMGFGDREAALMVQGIEVAGIPLPGRLIPEVLTALGRSDREGLPEEAVAVLLPTGIAAAHVEGDMLILVADR